MASKKIIVVLLRELLLNEYLQRDIYETYSYYLFGLTAPAIQEHLKIHQQEEQTHIEILQRYLMGLGEPPMRDRVPVPEIPLKLTDILLYNLDLERKAVKTYSECIHTLEPHVEHTALRVDLEDILKQEQEHLHDLVQWLEARET